MKNLIFIIFLISWGLAISQPINMIERELRYPINSLDSIIKNSKFHTNRISPIKSSDNKILSVDNQLVSSIGELQVESEVHAAINPTDENNIVISPIFQNSSIQTLPLYCPIYVTKDGGNSWSKSNFNSQVFNETIFFALGGGDPVFAFDNNGKLYFTWIYLYVKQTGNTSSINTAMYWAYSEDGGVNWIKPEDPYIFLFSQIGSSSQGLEIADKQWMTVNKKNDLFVSYTLIENSSSSQKATIMVAKLPNNKSEFEPPVQVSPNTTEGVQFSTITTDNDDNLHILYTYFAENELNLLHAYSTNDGESYSVPKKVVDFKFPKSILDQSGSNDTVPGITSRRLYPAPLLVADNSPVSIYNNNLYITWTANGLEKNEGNGTDIYFMKSTNGGVSWGTPMILNQDEKGIVSSQYYSSMSVNKSGIIAVSYYDRSLTKSDDLITDYVIQYSYDGGETFTEAIVVSAASTDFSSIGLNNGGFGIGEYNMLLTTEEFAIPVWADGRSGNGGVKIYAAKVPYSTSGVETSFDINSVSKISNIYFDNKVSILNIESHFDIQTEYSIEIYNLKGKLLLKTNTLYSNKGKNLNQLNFDNQTSGVYLIHFKGKGINTSAKFIKN